MAYGMVLYNSSGGVDYDSSSEGGVFVTTLQFQPGQSGMVGLPSYVTSMELDLVPIQAGFHTYSVEKISTVSGSGFWRVSWSPKYGYNPQYPTSNIAVPSELNVSTIILVLAK